MILERHSNESLREFLFRIEEARDMADLQAIEAAKNLHVNETESFRKGITYSFDSVLQDINRFRNTSRALTQQAIDVTDQIKTERFVEKWERGQRL